MKKGGANLPCTWGRQTCLKKKKRQFIKTFCKGKKWSLCQFYDGNKLLKEQQNVEMLNMDEIVGIHSAENSLLEGHMQWLRPFILI